MIRRPPRSTRTDPLFPYTTLFRSLDALLPILIRHDAPAHAVQLRASKPIEKPSRTFDHNVRDMASPFDGVVDLLAAMPKKPANRFAWVLGLDDADVACLLAAWVGKRGV